jgi:hypothetical protein
LVAKGALSLEDGENMAASGSRVITTTNHAAKSKQRTETTRIYEEAPTAPLVLQSRKRKQPSDNLPRHRQHSKPSDNQHRRVDRDT